MPIALRSAVLVVAAAMAVTGGELNAQTLQPTSRVPLLPSDGPLPDQPQDKSLLASLTSPEGPGGTSIADFMSKPAAGNTEAKSDLPAISADFVRTLRGSPTPVVTELKSLGERYDLIRSAAASGNATAENTLLAALILDRPSSDQLVDSLRVLDKDIADQVISDMNEARRLLATYTGDQVIASLLAQGAVRSGLSGTNDAGTVGTGSIGLSLAKRDWQLAGLITVASSVDTLRSGFGSFLLSPASGKGSLSTFLVDVHTPRIPCPWKHGKVSGLCPGLHMYVAGANSIWERQTLSPDPTDPTAIDTARSHKQSAVLGLGALLKWRITRGRLLNVPVQISIESGYSRRYLRGDIFADTAFIRGTLQSPDEEVRKSWGAWESGFQMAIGAVAAGVQYYWIDGNDDKSFISGLTSGQLIIGIAVAGDVVSGLMTP